MNLPVQSAYIPAAFSMCQVSRSINTRRLVQCVWRHRADGARVPASGDTTPRKVTPVILHGVVSPNSALKQALLISSVRRSSTPRALSTHPLSAFPAAKGPDGDGTRPDETRLDQNHPGKPCFFQNRQRKLPQNCFDNASKT